MSVTPGILTRIVIVGELGTPWDMKSENRLLGLAKGKLHEEDYEEPAKAMDQLLNSCGTFQLIGQCSHARIVPGLS